MILHFAETYFKVPGERVFNISINGAVEVWRCSADSAHFQCSSDAGLYLLPLSQLCVGSAASCFKLSAFERNLQLLS